MEPDNGRSIATTKELMKLARDEWRAAPLSDDLYIRLRVEAHYIAVRVKDALEQHAEVSGLSTHPDTLTALNTLILVAPVDPVEQAADELADQYHYTSRQALLIAINRGIKIEQARKVGA